MEEHFQDKPSEYFWFWVQAAQGWKSQVPKNYCWTKEEERHKEAEEVGGLDEKERGTAKDSTIEVS
jgi:hypothetical protein